MSDLKGKAVSSQQTMVFDEGLGLSTQEQQYDPTSCSFSGKPGLGVRSVRRVRKEWHDQRPAWPHARRSLPAGVFKRWPVPWEASA